MAEEAILTAAGTARSGRPAHCQWRCREINSLVYFGNPVQKLAEHRRFEEVAWLLWHGELPNAQHSPRSRPTGAPAAT